MPTGNHNDVNYEDPGLFPDLRRAFKNINKVVQQAHKHDIGETTFQAYVYRVNVSSDYTALPGKHSATRHALMQDGTMDDQYLNVYAYPDDPLSHLA